jgi:hypothetical protein
VYSVAAPTMVTTAAVTAKVREVAVASAAEGTGGSRTRKITKVRAPTDTMSVGRAAFPICIP